MSILFDTLKVHFKKQLPFVCYCKPNSEKIIALFQKNDKLFELNNADSGFAFVSFDNEKRFLIPESQSDIYFENVETYDFVFSNDKQFPTDLVAKTNHEKLVEKAVQEIENGTFQKVVLSRTETIDVVDFDLEVVFNKLIFQYQNAFKYVFFHPKVGLWMGATPEQFLKIDKNKIQTVSLAGTILNTGSEMVMWSNKEINEQQIVTDYIVEYLKKYAKNVSFSKPYDFKAGSLIHIKTDIEATFENQSDLENSIQLLHPTPAVCGFPKDAAKEFILKNEAYNREFYAGFLGEWNKDFLTYKENCSDLFVNLRCMKIENEQARLYVGGGINKGSNPEKEYIETVNKSQTMKKVL
ncbi:isochorismate synthase [Flavobacterium sp. SUN052]|uniref:isochorismate synthase n=1 Tax=Flavobacterium sp. SUN052 TaxID=3002441 RepID=UPI00237EDCFF|nr:isochorismate synthase [Flavobacterium sp. SUN052]MEC4003657.1 isochorismate synthase [Flavobacterium sp. SUN052]